MNIIKLSLFFVCVFITGCTKPTVTARSFYTSRKELASYVIDTPDPAKSTEGLGQLIWVSWKAPKLQKDTYLDAIIRFHDGSEEHTCYPISRGWGWMMIPISPEIRTKRHGMLSYKIILRHNETELAHTQHKLWVEKIAIAALSEPQESE